jgi:DNA-3-methyladenine glycosylase
MKLSLSYYKQNNVVEIACDLIGKEIFTNINGQITSGIISETEAYAGITDKASHAYGGKRTQRTETMFLKGGRTYVYLCYGMHKMLNIVTGPKDTPHAVLIRSIVPKSGIRIMKERTGKTSLVNISNGPGKLCKALGIEIKHNNISLLENEIWIQDNDFTYEIKGYEIEGYGIKTTKRIGIDYAGEDAKLPYRFVIE